MATQKTIKVPAGFSLVREGGVVEVYRQDAPGSAMWTLVGTADGFTGSAYVETPSGRRKSYLAGTLQQAVDIIVRAARQ